ncbi:MAG: folylpolyglutamate synthase/dihydrofolate synthase family protein [Elusimicrobiota bacterium]
MKYEQALKYVENLGEFSYDFDLTRIRNFLEKLGNPQDKIKIIHVAGTNGKGSVCAYISTVLQKAGYKVGLYTSPHLLDIRERLQINRKKIPRKYFTEFVTNYSALINRYSLTYFELLTAMAFWYFERERVDFAVIEVGLGGRLDATNVIKNPLVSVITNISLEHTQYLGNTVSKIAREKAGIIKSNGFVVTGTSGIALQTIEKIAKIKKARVIVSKKQKNYETSLFGIHQKQNANLAMGVCRLLDIPEKYIIDGLQNTVWPARFEIKHLTSYGSQITVISDCAHNPTGIAALKNSVEKYFKKNINFVFGVLSDKDYKEMIKIISSVAKNVFISAPKNERALSVEITKKEFAKHVSCKNIFVFDDIKNAVKSAIKKSEDFCVTGSVYTVAEAMKCLTVR